MAGKKRRPQSKRRSKRKAEADELRTARSYIRDWFHGYPPPPPPAVDDDFLPPSPLASGYEPFVFELHCHSNHSDGTLSTAALVERAHRNGVKVLALTDHDTMSGITEAVKAAQKYGIKIIPGVEISTVYAPRKEDPGNREFVHILAYYSSSGPSRYEELENLLSNIRDGRYDRAKNMLLKLSKLKIPVKWEHVAKVAGEGVAPGRVHIAQALVEAGHVLNQREAFDRYLYDGGPAYATGSEPFAEVVLQLICDTGGIAALAHPWSLKNPLAIVRSLKGVGLHAMEVYRCDGKVPGFDELADTYGLIKIGGSDYHGRGDQKEFDLGKVNLPITSLHDFLKMARPVWCNALKEILRSFVEEPSDANLEKITRFGDLKKLKGCSNVKNGKDIVDSCLLSWFAEDEKDDEFEAIRLKLADTFISKKLALTSL